MTLDVRAGLERPVEEADAAALKTLHDLLSEVTSREAVANEEVEVERARSGSSVDIIELAAKKGEFLAKIWGTIRESSVRHKWYPIMVFPRPQSRLEGWRNFWIGAPTLELGYKQAGKASPYILNWHAYGEDNLANAKSLQALWDGEERKEQQAIVMLAVLPRGDMVKATIDRFSQR